MPAKADGLTQKIKNLISLTGPIGVDVYMQMCLYDNEFGYYKTQKPIGATGDFITAPEISQMFGEICGIWLYVNWQKIGSPSYFHLIELGAGRGTLMSDMLRSFRALCKGVDCPTIEIAIIETNKHLIDLQKSALKNETIHETTQWHGNLSLFLNEKALKRGDFPLIFIANEFLDCFPIKQFVKSEKGWHEKQIGLGKDENLSIGLGPMITYDLPASADAEFFEYSLHSEAVLGDIFEEINALGGAALFIDYGYYNEYAGDTLQALYRHEKVPILERCGQADLTAHVDFKQISEIAEQIGISDFTIQSQRNFLCQYGIIERAQKLIAANPDKMQSIKQDLERLIGLDQMGELFKVFECSYSKD